VLGCRFFFNNVRNRELPVPVLSKISEPPVLFIEKHKNQRTVGPGFLFKLLLNELEKNRQFLASWLILFIFENLTKAESLIRLGEKLL
jgi:hypothetical protein